MIRAVLSLALALFATAAAAQVPSIPPANSSSVQPTGSQGRFPLRDLTGAGNYLLPLSHLGVIKPNTPGNTSTDAGTFFETVANSTVTCSGNVVSVVTSASHLVQSGGTVTIVGATPSGFNGTWTGISVGDSTHYSFSAPSCPGASASPVGSTTANRTISMTVEVPDDFSAVKLVFANQSGTNPWTLTSASVAGSASIGTLGDTSNIPGASAWDASGTAATQLCGATDVAICWSPVTFGNGGTDSPNPPGVMPIATPTTCWSRPALSNWVSIRSKR